MFWLLQLFFFTRIRICSKKNRRNWSDSDWQQLLKTTHLGGANIKHVNTKTRGEVSVLCSFIIFYVQRRYIYTSLEWARTGSAACPVALRAHNRLQWQESELCPSLTLNLEGSGPHHGRWNSPSFSFSTPPEIQDWTALLWIYINLNNVYLIIDAA